MKRILIVAAAALAFAAVSCDKETGGTDPSGKKDPEKREVIITCGQEQTKVTGSAADNGAVSFTWNNGDYLWVTAKGSSSYYPIESGYDGKSEAKFKGELPEGADENTEFTIQWPDKEPDLSSQTYVKNGIQGAKMLAVKTVKGVTALTAGNIALAPQYAVVRLDIKGDATLGTVTLTAGSVSYALSCTSVTLKDDSATKFYIVAKPTTATGKLTLNLKDSSNNDLGTFETSKDDLQLKAGVTLKLGELTIYKDGTFTSTDFNAKSWNSHESGTGAGDFSGETW